MIKTLILDFGDVFINLDKVGAMQNALNVFGLKTFEADMIVANERYETGTISTQEFVKFYRFKFPNVNENQLIGAWNFIIKDFPKYRLDFLQQLVLKNNYKLILLSNTNDLHIDYVKQTVPFYDAFKNCFDAFYLSQQIHFRKPNQDIFEFVLQDNNLNANECLFIDDTKANTDTAAEMGFHIWNIDETKEDVITLFDTKKDLF